MVRRGAFLGGRSAAGLRPEPSPRSLGFSQTREAASTLWEALCSQQSSISLSAFSSFFGFSPTREAASASWEARVLPTELHLAVWVVYVSVYDFLVI
jgi:hypothetical protein